MMGALLGLLQPRHACISEYKGKTIAIDGNSLLHRSATRREVSIKLALNEPTDAYVKVFMHYMHSLKYHGVTPIVVFEGLTTPLKQAIEEKRRSERQVALKKGIECYKRDNNTDAEHYLGQAMPVSDDMVIAVMDKLAEKSIQCIMAPNETAAQLAYLEKTGKVAAVATYDNNLLGYGCTNVLYEFLMNGWGNEVCMDKVKKDDTSIFYGYNAEITRHICILLGCDYLPAIKGVSLETVLESYKKNKNTNLVLLDLELQFEQDVPADYIKKFRLANLGFLHQWVYDMDKKEYVRLNPLPSDCSQEDIKLLGRVPTVQDSTLFRVNEVISKLKPKPRLKPKDNPLQESITKEFLAYVDTVKENIMPSHLGSPFPSASPKSRKSPLSLEPLKSLKSLKTPKGSASSSATSSSTSSLEVKARRALSELRVPRPSKNIVSVADASASTSGRSSSRTSRPREAAQGEIPAAYCRKTKKLPRKPRQVATKSATATENVTNQSAPSSSHTDSSRAALSEPTSVAATAAADTHRVCTRDHNLRMIHNREKQKDSPHSPPLHYKVKHTYQRMKGVPESTLLSLPISPLSPPSSHNPTLMPLPGTSTNPTLPRANVVRATHRDDATKPTQDLHVHLPQTRPSKDNMLSITTMNTSDPTTSISNISSSDREVSHPTSQTSSSQASKVNRQHHSQRLQKYTNQRASSPPSPAICNPSFQAGKLSRPVNTSPRLTPAYIPKNAHNNYSRSSLHTFPYHLINTHYSLTEDDDNYLYNTQTRSAKLNYDFVSALGLPEAIKHDILLAQNYPPSRSITTPIKTHELAKHSVSTLQGVTTTTDEKSERRSYKDTEHSPSTVQGNIAEKHMPSDRCKATPNNRDPPADSASLTASVSGNKESTTTQKRSFDQMDYSIATNKCNQPRKKFIPTLFLHNRHHH
ncbi:hypothetical protein MBANPS3_006711 [Mucor bainieri]